MRRRIRLHLRLLSFVPRVIIRTYLGRDCWHIFSEVEAIHCALGHDYNRELILPRHEAIMQGKG